MTTETNFDFGQGAVKKATQGLTSGDLWNVPRDRIHVVPGFNVREETPAYKARVKAIADSIEANGYMRDKPIAGFVGQDDDENDVIFCTDGHTRLAAIDLLLEKGVEVGFIPVVTKPRGTSMEDLTIGLYVSNTGEKLTPFEVGTVCKRLVGYGMEPKDIAHRLGITKVYVDQLLDLVAAPKAVRDLVSQGKVSATLASQTLKKHGKAAGKVLAEGVKQAEAKGKSRVTAKHVKGEDKKATKATYSDIQSDGGMDPRNEADAAAVNAVAVTLDQMVNWIETRGLQEDLNVLSLAAFITQVNVDELQKLLSTKTEDEQL